MIKEEIKFETSAVFEGMTSIRAVISAIDNKISDRRITNVLYDRSKKSKIVKELGYLAAVSGKYGFSLTEKSEDDFNKITVGSSHGGIVAICTDRTVPRLTSLPAPRDGGFYTMLQGVEDPYNFGYAIRSLYACGCDGIILPERNWMSAAGVVCRSSAGASELIPMFTDDATDTVGYFKEHGYFTVFADEDTDNTLGSCALPCPLLLVIGGERRGISRALLNLADMKVRINYARNFRASLSAASATTMFAYEIMRQNFKNKQ